MGRVEKDETEEEFFYFLNAPSRSNLGRKREMPAHLKT